MSTVTKASLESKIRRLEMFEQSQDGQLRLSLNEEYQLEAYRMLLKLLQPVQLPSPFSVGDNEDDPSYFNDWVYEVDEVKEALTEHGLELGE